MVAILIHISPETARGQGANFNNGVILINRVIINGKTYDLPDQISGVCIKNGEVRINGQRIDGYDGEPKHITIEGDVGEIVCDCDVIVNGHVKGDVECGGSCSVKHEIKGDVVCGGSCNAGGRIFGDIHAGGSVSCGGSWWR